MYMGHPRGNSNTVNLSSSWETHPFNEMFSSAMSQNVFIVINQLVHSPLGKH